MDYIFSDEKLFDLFDGAYDEMVDLGTTLIRSAMFIQACKLALTKANLPLPKPGYIVVDHPSAYVFMNDVPVIGIRHAFGHMAVQFGGVQPALEQLSPMQQAYIHEQWGLSTLLADYDEHTYVFEESVPG